MILFMLIAAHFICDFPLQSDAIAINKNRNARTELQKHVPYQYWGVAHGFCHGAAVALITGSVWLGIAETVCHYIIDFGKCEKYYNIHIDQLLHMVCKIIWVIILVVI